MPATTGASFLVSIGNERQTITISGGGGSDTYKLTYRGQKTTALAQDATFGAVQAALVALSTIGAGNVVVTGNNGGPYTVTFQGALAGQQVPELTVSDESGGLGVVVAQIAAVYTSLGGQRKGSLNRKTKEADLTNKDSDGDHEGAPTIRDWQVSGDRLIIETDAAGTALEYAYNSGLPVRVQVTTPANHTYTGEGTITDFSFDGPYEDAFAGSITINGSKVLTKA